MIRGAVALVVLCAAGSAYSKPRDMHVSEHPIITEMRAAIDKLATPRPFAEWLPMVGAVTYRAKFVVYIKPTNPAWSELRLLLDNDGERVIAIKCQAQAPRTTPVLSQLVAAFGAYTKQDRTTTAADSLAAWFAPQEVAGGTHKVSLYAGIDRTNDDQQQIGWLHLLAK